MSKLGDLLLACVFVAALLIGLGFSSRVALEFFLVGWELVG